MNCRFHFSVVLAAAVPTAAILLKGPKSHRWLITWDLETGMYGDARKRDALLTNYFWQAGQ